MLLKKTCSRMLLSAMLGTALLAGAVPALADCRHDIERAQINLDKAVRKHGEHSRQAEQRRHELEAVRERCHDRH
jgi:hypothetical protein